MKREPKLALKGISIERHTERDPKRFSTFKDVRPNIFFLSAKNFADMELPKEEFPETVTQEVWDAFISDYLAKLDLSVDTMTWFTMTKDVAEAHKFAPNNKAFKEGGYLGKAGEILMVMRILLCGAKQTPDLYSVMQVLGMDEVKARLSNF